MVIFWIVLLLAYGSGSFAAGAKYGRAAEQAAADEVAKIKAEALAFEQNLKNKL